MRAAACTSLAASAPRRGLSGLTSTANRSTAGHQLVQQLQPLGQPVRQPSADAGDVAARPVKAGDEPSLTGSLPSRRRSGLSRSPALAAQRDGAAGRDDHGDLPPNQIGRQRRQPIAVDPPPSGIRSRRSGPRHSRASLKPLAEARDAIAHASIGRAPSRNPITGIAGCCARAASGHATAAPPSSVMNSRRSHSITSSARASSVGGMSRPSALAVLRLMTSSNLVGCTTGRSAAFRP